MPHQPTTKGAGPSYEDGNLIGKRRTRSGSVGGFGWRCLSLHSRNVEKRAERSGVDMCHVGMCITQGWFFSGKKPRRFFSGKKPEKNGKERKKKRKNSQVYFDLM